MKILYAQVNHDPPVGFRRIAMPGPLWALTLAAMTPDHEQRVLDLRCEGWEATGDYKPDIVAVSALTPELNVAKAVLREAKRRWPECWTVVGGHHATLCPEDWDDPNCGVVYLGEAENSFCQLVEALGSGQALAGVPNLVYRFNGGRAATARVREKEIPTYIPRWDLVDPGQYSWFWHKPSWTIQTSRGCDRSCSFCSIPEIYDHKVRLFDLDTVVRQVEAVPAGEHIPFVDDDFLIVRKRAMELAERIKALGVRHTYGFECRADAIVERPDIIKAWAGIGLEVVFLGLESASSKELRGFGKRSTRETNDEAIRILHANGIKPQGAFIVSPNWTESDFQRLADYINARRIMLTQISILTPLPGTRLFEEMAGELLVDHREHPEAFDCQHAVTETRLPRRKFYEQFAPLHGCVSVATLHVEMSAGRLTMAQLRWGRAQLPTAEDYAAGDPVLGKIERTELEGRRLEGIRREGT